jgi:Sulfotransferase family
MSTHSPQPAQDGQKAATTGSGVSSHPSMGDFRPCFVVGNERSGTTLLTVLLGRHSELATTPETHFLSLVPRKKTGPAATRTELLDQLFAWRHTADMKLDRTRLTARFNKFPADYASLFRAMLEEYAAEHAPGKTRIGEKTPLHLLSVPTLMEWYPQGRVVCIVRDGRDVVLSLLNMSWNHEHRLRPLCMNWMRLLKIAEDYQQQYPERFLLIRYEDLLDKPQEILQQVDEFLGLKFEPQQLDASAQPTNVVPEAERGWKGQALEQVDPSRKATWKKKATPQQLLVMNTLMGKALRHMGYGETDPPRCTLGERVRAAAGNVAFRVGLFTLWNRLIERNLPSARAERRRRRNTTTSAT